MERDQLELWLCDWRVVPPSPYVVAEALGLPVGDVADTTLLRIAGRVCSLRFTLAVLQDVFAADADLRRWLDTPRVELGGLAPRAAIMLGKERAVELVAVETWNETWCMAGAA